MLSSSVVFPAPYGPTRATERGPLPPFLLGIVAPPPGFGAESGDHFRVASARALGLYAHPSWAAKARVIRQGGTPRARRTPHLSFKKRGDRPRLTIASLSRNAGCAGRLLPGARSTSRRKSGRRARGQTRRRARPRRLR